MAMTVGVRFRNGGKVYDFNPRDLGLRPGELVVVETANGPECGEVVSTKVEAGEITRSHKPVLRRADDVDRRKMEELTRKEQEALQVCRERVEAYGLEMKLVNAEYTFDGSKIFINFTADGRVDFRELVRDLMNRFHTRVELHQIGVRDEAKMLGGVGICGEPFCCSRFLNAFQPVTIKMAKEQGLSLNPTKISGSCGRLMCCLKYEQDTYEELLKLTPKVGALVSTPEGRGIVTECAVLTGRIKVRLDKTPDSPPADFTREDITVIDNRPGRNRPAPAAETEPAPAAAPSETASAEAPADDDNGGNNNHGNRDGNRDGNRGNRGRNNFRRGKRQ